MNFKKWVLGIFLTLAITEIYAQSPTFEETVTYITQNIKGRVMYPGDLDAYSRVEGYRLEDVKIERNGKIELITKQLNKSTGYTNNFNIVFNIFDLVEKVDYPDGIRAYKFLVHFNGLNVSSGYGITFATDADAQKVARAFRHLKTVCVKDNDLFSKIPAEEKKPQLSREETIEYLNNKLKEAKSEYYTYKISNNECEITYTKEHNYAYHKITETFIFNLKNIKEISINYYKENDPNGINIKFSSNKVKHHVYDYGDYMEKEWGHGYYNVLGTYIDQYRDVVRTGVIKDETTYISEFFYYDPNNANRIKKAFERLIELCQEEKDPFDD